MTWLDVTWIALATASATLGLLNLFIWCSRTSGLAHLLFFVMTGSIAAVAVFELGMMHSSTAREYAAALRWGHLPLAIAVLSMIGFVRSYFQAGLTWLAGAACSVRLVVVVLNFTTGDNINFSHVTALEHVTLPGGAGFSVPVGTLNPWWSVAQIGNLLLIGFLVDASVALWRRRDPVARRRAQLVGGGLVLCVVCVVALALGTFFGGLRLPTVVTPAFLAVALAMGLELGADTLRAAQLSRDLRASERRSELTAQAAQLGLWSWDPTTDEVWVNPLARSLFSIPHDQLLGLGQLVQHVESQDQAQLRSAVAEALGTGGSFELEFRVNNSPTRWISTRGHVERRDTGEPLVRAVSMDISERRRVERELIQQRDELTHLSRVAALGEMAGSLAHEMNQPLMAIMSNAQAAQRFMASDSPDLAEVRAAIADIVQDDRRAGEVIRRLRALLRKGEIQRGPLDINDVVLEVLRLARSELMNREVVATTELADNLPPLLGDRIQLQQVLLNLIMNSCDAMHGTSGSHALAVRTRLVDGEGGGVEVSVSDSGRGIPPADLERIFEPFVTTKEHGMGLGLSVCRTIIGAHGGRLWARNTDGGGAALQFVLPLTGGQS
jgi:two-component system, LuxR family, sensor kinase FixL